MAVTLATMTGVPRVSLLMVQLWAFWSYSAMRQLGRAPLHCDWQDAVELTPVAVVYTVAPGYDSEPKSWKRGVPACHVYGSRAKGARKHRREVSGQWK